MGYWSYVSCKSCRTNPFKRRYQVNYLEPEAFYLADKITGILNIFSHDKINSFVESACWPDDVKTFGLSSMDPWHFIDIPVRFPEIKQNITNGPSDALGILVLIFNTAYLRQDFN